MNLGKKTNLQVSLATGYDDPQLGGLIWGWQVHCQWLFCNSHWFVVSMAN